MPMIFASTAADPVATMRARGLMPELLRLVEDIMTRAAAPSLMPEELPAVTVPSLTKTGLSFARSAMVRPCRGCSSVSKMVDPFLVLISTGTSSLAWVLLLIDAQAR